MMVNAYACSRYIMDWLSSSIIIGAVSIDRCSTNINTQQLFLRWCHTHTHTHPRLSLSLSLFWTHIPLYPFFSTPSFLPFIFILPLHMHTTHTHTHTSRSPVSPDSQLGLDGSLPQWRGTGASAGPSGPLCPCSAGTLPTTEAPRMNTASPNTNCMRQSHCCVLLTRPTGVPSLTAHRLQTRTTLLRSHLHPFAADREPRGSWWTALRHMTGDVSDWECYLWFCAPRL